MMKWKTFVIGYALALALLLFAQHRPEQTAAPAAFSRIVDLTHSIGSSTAASTAISRNLPLQPQTIAAVASYQHGQKVNPRRFPTRLDAPAHAVPGLWTVDQIPPERLFAPLVVLDVRSQAAKDSDYQLSVADIANWEQAHGQIPQGAVVMARTGWALRWPSPQQYRPVDSRGVAHFPGFSLQAARFLIQGRNVVGLGIDTASVDPGSAMQSPVRQYAANHSVYQIENVANLADAPGTGGLVLVAPAKLQGGSAAPVRVLALGK
jgi:kynurenine formamidase